MQTKGGRNVNVYKCIEGVAKHVMIANQINYL